MNKTIDLQGADDQAQQKRPFTISFTEESCPPKKFNIRYLLAQQYVKENRKKSQFSLYHITQRDYYHPSYLPTRSPVNLQMQNLNNTTKSTQQKQFSKSFNLKCKTLPLNDQQLIYKRIDFKNKILERMSQIRNRSITCKIPDSNQFRTIQTEISSQSPKFHIKNQEIYTQRPPQSRVNSSFQKCKKICLVRPAAYTLGLNVEKCKIIDTIQNLYCFQKKRILFQYNVGIICLQCRLKTISSSPQEKPVKIRAFKINCIQDIQQKMIINKTNIQNLNFKKKSSITLAKWDYSDFEND